ncbi:dentin sialophosphoprotein-like isoform X2 [Odontomachus brunneus]|nr:dentin sialophosphoprotein-like isoform X2 [Odontomachus brunneus]
MCDLIDLNSPDVKGLINSKLSSPLIPVPGNIESDEQASSSITEKCESLGSNPFDNVLHETAEYVKKKGDPFEVMLQRALKHKSNKSTKLEAESVIFKDDFTPKRRKKFLKKMNKTLDESLIEDRFGSIDGEKKEKTVNLVTSNTICNNNVARGKKLVPKQSNKIIIMNVGMLKLSVLGQFNIYNKLYIIKGHKHKENNEILIFSEKDSLFNEFVLPKNSTRKSYFDLHHSLSQNRKSLTESQSLDKRSQSMTDTLRISSQSDSTMLSCLNTGFLKSSQSQQSVFTDSSDVSSMARSDSVSTSNLLPILPNSIVNHCAFLDNDSMKMNNERINTAENSTEMKSIQYNLSDLTERRTLSYAINRTANTSSFKEEISQSNSMKGEDGKPTMDNKLIDIDIFFLEQSSNKEHNKSTNSTNSSDSVFIDNSKADKLILNEAKELSRIFEDLTVRTDSVSSTDDLLSNDTLWIRELLPAFEDEAVDNLIEFLVSPKKNVKDDKKNDLKQSPASINNAGENFMKNIESQFTDCVPSVKQTMVATLLSDLKKLVEAENNSEASKLIDNLESVLGVRYKNNTELLASLNVSNELQIFEMTEDKLNKSKQSDKTSVYISKNQEENRELSCEEKICDKKSLLQHINHKSEDMSQAATVSNDNSLAKSSPCNNNEDPVNIIISPKIELSTSLTNKKDTDEQLAVELLVNLAKLLSGQAEDATILRLLKSIGKALNIASNNCKSEEKLQRDDKSCNTERIMALEPEHNVHLVDVTESTQKQDINLKFKQLEKTSRRSISTMHSSNANTSNTQVKAKRKNTSGLKNEKHFSNQPGFINTVANNKVSGASNMRIAEAVDLNDKNEEPLAIIDIKKKLKKKSDIVNKRGPMKAMHSVSSVQKKVSLGKRTAPSSQVITPPKSNTTASFGSKIISSTPNSMTSSTSSDQTEETLKTQLKSTDKKRNFSCDISPVSTQERGSPRRSIQLPPAKICTPKRQRADSSGIPKYRTPPRKLNCSLDMSSHHQQSPQYLNKSLTSYQRYSPIRPKSAEKRPQSPLKESNKFLAKVKPFKLISKILKGSTTNDFTEKENSSE